MENGQLISLVWTLGVFVIVSMVSTPLVGILLALFTGFWVAVLFENINKYFPGVTV
jgi:hypothetical protein